MAGSSAEARQPQLLYRYMSLATPERKTWALDSICESKLYLTSPATLNDPFELRFDMKFGFTDEAQLLRELEDPGVRRALQIPNDAVLSPTNLRRLIEHLRTQETIVPQGFRDAVLARYAVCCFSARSDGLLLWSYYADGHRGLCLEFGNTGPDAICARVHPVMYQDAYPSFTYPRDRWEQITTQVFLTKAKAWAHESEWRLTDVHRPAGYRSFNPLDLTAVTFGCEMTRDACAEIADIVRRAQPHVRLQRARRRKSRFGLSIVPFP